VLLQDSSAVLCALISVEPEAESMKSKLQLPSFAPSKWETVDESELESQGNTSA